MKTITQLIYFFLISFSMLAHAETALPETNVDLLIYIQGKQILGEQDFSKIKLEKGDKFDEAALQQALKKNTVPIRRGESVQLKVERVGKDGIPVDITYHPATVYESTGPWSITVTDGGLVNAAPDPEFRQEDINKELGLAGIRIYTYSQARFGWNLINFEVKP